MAISPQQISTAESSLNNTITPSSIQWIFITLIFYFTAITTNYTLMMLWNILKHLWPQVDLLKVYTHDDNDKQSWAVVTGATDGIGLGFCQQLVSRGFNVCLISRNQAKLDKVKKHLQTLIACHQQQQQQSKQQPPLKKQKLLTLQLDFTQIQDNNKFNQLIKQLDKLHITILVNNVGVALIKQFQKCQYQQSVDLISVNCHTMALLNAYLIKRVNKEMDQKKSSNNSNANRYAIINLSSLAGYNPIPYITLYSSTKAFNRFISQGLSIEYPNIDIVNITPMHVESGGSNVKKQFNIPTSRECARDSLKQLRFRTYASFGYLSHCITGSALLTYLPKWFLRIVSKVEMKKLVDKYYTKKDQ